ncbi:MAG: acetyl/propionyl/methylcrotonyl-CoA carboxylase subunit alpha [Archangium sp.]|nr:acetyl/propionyl/methylcrotonyl-CoA carboxylase subunit alpha [Archangium sp.]MDP3155660.1 acetyl/propionyl/methylcrotonyl-CoA carboxylase subunit alpha [Archangium sp.]MDP3570734.1 acetyl/propionyl/methylcrotonyl-CoA carboxylase subunit alpha [Archangium sp.]
MFTKILIANRGEIACRVASTARRLGIKTVAVYSDADAGSKHVASCDEAVHLGPAAAKESYLVMEKILAAAKATGAQAIHPGYGFLSENEDFAEACVKAGITFIGPPASAISAMGLKSEAKSRMEKAKVPLVPGYHGADQSPALLQKEADRIGYPVLIKASAGGGGKGMRAVEKSEDFAAALESCKREAINAFGDDAVLIEKYLTRPRHIEVQVFADRHGECVYLFERDCSVQRRHQKVLEEAPAPGMSPARRAAMGEAAVAAAKAVGYEGAGTVEFISEGEQFYFMEMNTRLQVEHPVTEAITGLDLVEWQLRVAAGEKLPKKQSELTIKGHSLEARVYAENPEKGFLPAIGTLAHLRFPEHQSFVNSAVRVDSGVRPGDAITPFYDPMIAKLIVWGEDRQQALARMSEALGHTQIVGLSTNVGFLKRLVESKAFSSADLDTGLIAKNHAELFPETSRVPDAVLALAAAAVLAREDRLAGSDPWSSRTGWRVNQTFVRGLRLGAHEVQIAYGRAGSLFNGTRLTVSNDGVDYQLMLGEQPVRGTVVFEGETLNVFHAGFVTQLGLFDPIAHAGEDDSHGGKLVAPMPGKIVALLAKSGVSVKKGTALLVMEAMKMEHTITAPSDGTVSEYLFTAGDQVGEGAELLKFAPA